MSEKSLNKIDRYKTVIGDMFIGMQKRPNGIYVRFKEVKISLEKSRLKHCYHQANPCTKDMDAENRPCWICSFVFELVEEK